MLYSSKPNHHLLHSTQKYLHFLLQWIGQIFRLYRGCLQLHCQIMQSYLLFCWKNLQRFLVFYCFHFWIYFLNHLWHFLLSKQIHFYTHFSIYKNLHLLSFKRIFCLAIWFAKIFLHSLLWCFNLILWSNWIILWKNL